MVLIAVPSAAVLAPLSRTVSEVGEELTTRLLLGESHNLFPLHMSEGWTFRGMNLSEKEEGGREPTKTISASVHRALGQASATRTCHPSREMEGEP